MIVGPLRPGDRVGDVDQVAHKPAGRHALRGVAGGRPAGLDLRAMRAVQTRARKQRKDLSLAKDSRRRLIAERVDFGYHALQKLIGDSEMRAKARRKRLRKRLRKRSRALRRSFT